MIVVFEDLPNERAISALCADSMLIPSFLKWELHKNASKFSPFTLVRLRLGMDISQQIFNLGLKTWLEHGLLDGKNLRIDFSVIEASASLRNLVHPKIGELFRYRGMHIETGLAPILGCDGMKRTTLRDRLNQHKCFKPAAAFYNLHQRIQRLFEFEMRKELAVDFERGKWRLQYRSAAAFTNLATVVQRITSACYCTGCEFWELFRRGRKVISRGSRLLQNVAKPCQNS